MVKETSLPLGNEIAAHITDRVVTTAVTAARRAGEIQMQTFRDLSVGCTRLLRDVKLETDRRCETAIIEIVRAAFPDHAILSEESGSIPGCGDYTWIVDPLDGTVNFWHGIPFFCVSIACYGRDGGFSPGDLSDPRQLCKPVAGVVYVPVNQDLFVGVSGRGAFLNSQPIQVCRSTRTDDVVVSVSFGKTPEVMQCMTRKLDVLLPQVRKARCLGAAAAELAYVAAGFLGGVFYEGIKQWDFAAARILVEEAGGFFAAEETYPGRWRVRAGTHSLEASLGPLFCA